MEEKKAAKKEQGVAVFPVVLSIIPKNVFNKKNPIIIGCEVKEGSLKVRSSYSSLGVSPPLLQPSEIYPRCAPGRISLTPDSSPSSLIIVSCLQVGTPLCIPELEFLEIGKVTSIQNNHKEVKVAKVGMSVAVKIEPMNDLQSHILYGRQFDHKVKLYSKITREGIQAMKDHFGEDMTSDDWKLMSRLKQLFSRGIQHW
eukprot:756940-Hanusia_phi.AAC.3